MGASRKFSLGNSHALLIVITADMTRTDSPPLAPLAMLDSREEIDEELLALPDPPRRERTLTLLALGLAAIVSLAFAFSLRHDVRYALSPTDPVPVGALDRVPLAELPENQIVTATAPLGAAGAMRFERPFVEESSRIVPVLGRDDLWVEFQIPRGEVLGRFLPPEALRGRLVPFVTSGPHHRGLAAQLAELRGAPLSPHAMLLVQGEEPSSARSSILLALAAVLAAGWSVLTAARMLRKVRS